MMKTACQFPKSQMNSAVKTFSHRWNTDFRRLGSERSVAIRDNLWQEHVRHRNHSKRFGWRAFWPVMLLGFVLALRPNASAAGGQHLIVLPNSNTVIVRLGSNPNLAPSGQKFVPELLRLFLASERRSTLRVTAPEESLQDNGN